MNNDKENTRFDTDDLPQEEVFERKEVFQHPQPADMGKPLRKENPDLRHESPANTNERDKTSGEEGLNEAHSDAEAGAFEGFEDLGE
jgi:hypothetical protein